MKKWGALVVLSVAQFLMVLDQAVMNVSISQLVDDFDTTVTTIQGVITMYSLVMAALMITGGKIGDLIGRRRAFAVGLGIYAVGSALTAASWSVGSLALGWSILEGVGAALVLPALAALIAGNYEGKDRIVAYAVIGGVAGAGIAVGPILGGWMTTDFTWRLVFVGEVVIAIAILVSIRLIADAVRPGRPPQLDVVGAVLSAVGLGLVVYGILSASTWGWLAPKSSPVEVFGFSLTPFVVTAGALVLWAFRAWQRHREALGLDPLVRFALLEIDRLRAGLVTFLAQNFILMGIFFSIPLYLQLVQGLDALETGIQMLPVSITMFLASIGGSRLATRFSPRLIVQVGLGLLLVASVLLLGTIDPELDTTSFAVAMAILGVGLGLLASQLGNVVQSSVGAEDRGEAGGLQYTAQQLGSSLGVALVGAIVLSSLGAVFASNVRESDSIPEENKQQVESAVEGGVDFVSTDVVAQAADDAGIDQDAADEIVDDYSDAQLQALKAGLLVVAAVVLLSFVATRNLPSKVPEIDDRVEAPTEA